MKKVGLSALAVVTGMLAVFLLGFLIGRNACRTPVTLSQLPTAAAADPAEFRMNINTATAQQLDDLPGIGAVIAQRIVDYRTEHGPFQTTEELRKVTGIGADRFDRISQYITVGEST